VFQTAFISGDTNKAATVVLALVEPLLQKGHHSTDKNVLQLLERHFPENTTNRKKGQANKEVCSVLQKQ